MKPNVGSKEVIPSAVQAVKIHRGKAVDRAQRLQQIAREREEFDSAPYGLAGRNHERDDLADDR